MSFDVGVTWCDGSSNTVSLTDLLLTNEIKVLWRYTDQDGQWTGKLSKVKIVFTFLRLIHFFSGRSSEQSYFQVFDTMNVEVIWDNLSKENTCSFDDLIVLNREDLFESYVTWKYDPKWKRSIARDYAPKSRQNFNPSRHMQLQIRENNGYCEELSNEEDETGSRKGASEDTDTDDSDSEFSNEFEQMED